MNINSSHRGQEFYDGVMLTSILLTTRRSSSRRTTRQFGSGAFEKVGTSQKKSVYADEDSDVDMYECESDYDDEYEGGGK